MAQLMHVHVSRVRGSREREDGGGDRNAVAGGPRIAGYTSIVICEPVPGDGVGMCLEAVDTGRHPAVPRNPVLP